VAALAGVICGLGVSLLTYIPFHSSGPAALVAPALAGGAIGTLSGWAVSGWWRSGPWLSLVSVALAVAIVVVVPTLFFGRQNWQVGTVVWAVVLVPALFAVGILVRRGARMAGAVTGVVGGLLAVDAGVTSSLAWLVREFHTFGPLVWLWFLYSFDGWRHPFPGTLDLADEVAFWPHELIAATTFAVCLVLITQRAADHR
jgi:hypothetical protein